VCRGVDVSKDSKISLASLDRIIREMGVKRVSSSAVEVLREILEDIAAEIARRAREIADHAGRKTVIADDIKLAYLYAFDRRISRSSDSLSVARASAPSNRFEKEKRAFEEMKDKLLRDPNFQGKYVAVVGGKVVDVGEDKIELAKRVYKKYGYIPMFIGFLGKRKRVVEVPSPEIECVG